MELVAWFEHKGTERGMRISRITDFAWLYINGSNRNSDRSHTNQKQTVLQSMSSVSMEMRS